MQLVRIQRRPDGRVRCVFWSAGVLGQPVTIGGYVKGKENVVHRHEHKN